jgi:hypothetical protein
MRKRGTALAGAIAMTVVVAACGGGDSGGERLTKQEYIDAADAICGDVNEQLDALGEPGSFEDVARLAEDAVAIQRDALQRLRALNPPEGDEATLNQAYDLLDQQSELGDQMVEAANDEDEARITEIIGQLQGLDEQADQIARNYGLQECGTD